MFTFNMRIVRDKALSVSEDIQKITKDLRNRGLYPQRWDNDNNYFYIGGNISCTCGDKFDKAYCDEVCSDS